MLQQGQTRTLEMTVDKSICSNRKFIDSLAERNGKVLIDGVEYALLCDPTSNIKNPMTFKALGVSLDHLDRIGINAYKNYEEYEHGYYLIVMGGESTAQFKRGTK